MTDVSLSGSNRQNENIIRIFLLIWLIINWLQAVFTGALFDEHYYWMYSRHLDWGYFDHPPAIALIIKCGYAMFHSIFGIRLFIPLLSTASIYIIWKIVSAKTQDARLFIYIVASIVLVHAGGFSATPDVPLIFFASLFFYVYKDYVKNYDYRNAILLSFIIAALLYSKYHGLLVILFTLIANPRLFTKKSFYLIILLGCVFYLPHILWQVRHDYPTLKYQLSERFGSPYKLSFTTDFVLAQVLFAGAFSGIVLLYATLTYRVNSVFERSLKYTAIGIFIIFILSSFRGRVEANWAAVAFIPVIILGYNFLQIKSGLQRTFMYLSGGMICLIFLFRIMMITNTIPAQINIADEIAPGWKEWANDIQKAAEGRPVIFYNSYQKASRYTFYTGNESYTLNTNAYRRTQYEIWQTDSSFQGKDIIVVKNSPAQNFTEIKTPVGSQYYIVIQNYHSYDNVFISLPQKKFTETPGTSLEITVHVENEGRDVDFSANPLVPVMFYYTLEQNGEMKEQYPLDAVQHTLLKSGESFNQTLHIALPDIPGTYKILISFQVGNMYPGLQGEYHDLVIK